MGPEIVSWDGTEGDDKDDNIEGLKKENKNENEDSLVLTVENVKKLVQDRYGSRNIQEKNTTTYENL